MPLLIKTHLNFNSIKILDNKLSLSLYKYFYTYQKGYNCCIFAYGQTGSGKTYSILGILQDIIENIYA